MKFFCFFLFTKRRLPFWRAAVVMGFFWRQRVDQFGEVALDFEQVVELGERRRRG